MASSSSTTSGIDFDSLEALMDAASAQEARQAREEAAKFRAVAQMVPTFEAFEEMVKAAHIQPMTEDVTALRLKPSSWTPRSSGGAVATVPPALRWG